MKCETRWSVKQDEVWNRMKCETRWSVKQDEVWNKMKCETRWSVKQDEVWNRMKCETGWSVKQDVHVNYTKQNRGNYYSIFLFPLFQGQRNHTKRIIHFNIKAMTELFLASYSLQNHSLSKLSGLFFPGKLSII